MKKSGTGYLRAFRAELMEVYNAEGIEGVANFAAEKVLESYKNGLNAPKEQKKSRVAHFSS